MKTTRIIIMFCVALQSITVTAQKTSTDKIRFHSINQVGIIAGESDANLQLQSINGVKKSTWFAGIGVGLDYYYSRSIPLFLDVRKNIFNKPNTPFIYADGGYHFAWSSTKDEQLHWLGDEKNGGAYYEAGIGYAVPFFKKTSLLFSAGYSYKRFTQTVNSMPWISVWPPPQESFEKYSYDLRRVAIKVGVGF